MTRTYGTYTLRPGVDGARDQWVLLLEPAVRMRARRIFGRVQLTRSMEVTIADTDEVCRDLKWFMERFPLEPGDARSKERLQVGAREHVRVEVQLDDLRAGGVAQLSLEHEPAKPAREYQTSAVQVLRLGRRLLLTDEVGLGKTFTGLLACAPADARPALVVPPTHLPPRWETELQESFPWMTYKIAASTTPPAWVAAGDLPDVTIVPYSKLDGWAGYLKGLVRTVVFDEVQELRRGVVTLKGAAAALVTEDADFVMGLTATPVYNYGGEIFNVVDTIAPGRLGTREEFNREWVGSYVSGNAVIAEPDALGNYLREQGLMLGRTRKDVGRELPKAIKAPMVVDSDHAALDEVRESAAALAATIMSDTATAQEKWQAAGEIDWQVRRATGVDKAPYVADFVRLILESEQRVVLFGWHRDVYDIWLDRLADFNPLMYTGTESPKQKAAAEAGFTKPWDPDGDNHRILIMSLRSGAGVDGLQKVSRVAVFGELDWSPQVHEQALGRLRRDGMGDDPPVAYYLYSATGSDPALLEVLQVKRQQSEPMLTPDGKLLANATVDQGRARRLAEQFLTLKETA